jgi:hypothetical protein
MSASDQNSAILAYNNRPQGVTQKGIDHAVFLGTSSPDTARL